LCPMCLRRPMPAQLTQAGWLYWLRPPESSNEERRTDGHVHDFLALPWYIGDEPVAAATLQE
jgi:hypothetical protein